MEPEALDAADVPPPVTPAEILDPVDPHAPFPQLRTDAAGIVVGASRSNLLQPGCVAVSAEVYAAAAGRHGRCKLVDGLLVDYEPPPPPVDLAAYAKAARDAAENGGIVVSGVPVATDDRSKTLVLGARRRVEKDPAIVTSWAAADGNVYPLDAATIIAVSDAIGDFVAALFEAYAHVVSGILGGTVTTTAQIDATFGAVDVAF